MDQSSTRLAYFVLAHHRPQQLQTLLQTIAGQGDLVLLHVDLKSMLGMRPERNGTWRMARQLAQKFPNVVLMRPRFTNWGGWTLSQVLLDAIDMALVRDSSWTHFVNLSGVCLPIKPIEEIRGALAREPDLAYVELRHFSTLPADDWHLRWQAMIELPHKAVRLSRARKPPREFELIHKGSQWCILPRDFCEWQRQAPIANRIRRYLRGLLLSDELLMQTLVRNGPWRARVAPFYGRAIVWPGPKVMTIADWDMLDRSPAFFARKFDAEQDAGIVDAVLRKVGVQPLLAVA